MRSALLIDEGSQLIQLLDRCRSIRGKISKVSGVADARDQLNHRNFDLVIWDTASVSVVSDTEFREQLSTLVEKLGHAKAIIRKHDNGSDFESLTSEQVRFVTTSVSGADFLAQVKSLLGGGARHAVPCERELGNTFPIDFEGLIAVSLPMRTVIKRALDAAAIDLPVLITGETGTGKDLLAAGIHRRSRRRAKPFLAVNTGAMAPELIASEIFGHEKGSFTGAYDGRAGIFEQADGGTVFLDEIATMDAKTQVSLLRVLEEKIFRRVGGSKCIAADVRIIAAANEDLEGAVAERRFREDLFYRLNVVHIAVPPLRERPGAVTVLTDHFVAKFATGYGKEIESVAPETYKLLRHYRWPGNVRELKNVVQTAVLMADGPELTPNLIPQRILDSASRSLPHSGPGMIFQVGMTLEAMEKAMIRQTLASVRGNKKHAASVLGISRRALYNKIRRNELL